MMPNAVNRMYRGRMTVTVYQKQTKENGETVLQPKVLYADKACALSAIRSSLSQKLTVAESDGTYQETARYKIFCDNDFYIPGGSQITVTQEGRAYVFAYAGEGFVYSTHQELTVKKQERF
jgi:hypothetical protein